MIFGEIPVSEAENTLLARSIGGLKKGQKISAEHIAQLQKAGIDKIRAAKLEKNDLNENDSANIIAASVAGAHIKHPPADKGRVHFYAQSPGLLLMQSQKIDRLNHVSQDIALACLAPFAPVRKDQLIATLKIIPLACAKTKIARAENIASQAQFRIMPFRPLQAILLSTHDDAKKNMSAKAETITRKRLEALGSQLKADHCPDESAAIAKKIKNISADLILIHGASAITDQRDIIPAAIEQIGGRLIHFGMPADPGNLLLLAEYQNTPIIGLPGCARSPKRNGFDLVLERIAAGLTISSDDIMAMGIGGLMLGDDIDQERYG